MTMIAAMPASNMTAVPGSGVSDSRLTLSIEALGAEVPPARKSRDCRRDPPVAWKPREVLTRGRRKQMLAIEKDLHGVIGRPVLKVDAYIDAMPHRTVEIGGQLVILPGALALIVIGELQIHPRRRPFSPKSWGCPRRCPR